MASIKAASLAKRERYTFSYWWFEGVRDTWVDATLPLRGRPLRILELGCFEGASSTWLLDELAEHPQAHLTTVDTFGGSMEHQDGGKFDYQVSTLRQRFDHNIEQTGRSAQARIMQMTTQQALAILGQEQTKFDFVYIDASHTSKDVLADAVNGWPLLEVGGTMVFDDYEWSVFQQSFYNPGMGIQSFLDCFAPELRYGLKGGQIWSFKMDNYMPPIMR